MLRERLVDERLISDARPRRLRLECGDDLIVDVDGPVLVVQSNEFNESAIRTSICVVITPNMRLAAAPGNVRVTRRVSSLPHDSVVNVSQLITLDKSVLTAKVSRLPAESMREVAAGIKLVLAL